MTLTQKCRYLRDSLRTLMEGKLNCRIEQEYVAVPKVAELQRILMSFP
jgi:hypothetical protein